MEGEKKLEFIAEVVMMATNLRQEIDSWRSGLFVTIDERYVTFNFFAD